MSAPRIESAEVVLPCAELDRTLSFFTDRLGFRVEAIFPADDPAVAVISGYGIRLRLERGADVAPGALRLRCVDIGLLGDGATQLTAPNGTHIELVDTQHTLQLPPLRPSLVVNMAADAEWQTGRAGMQYRDLVPDRQGGRYIVSHIRIPGGGPVPDYVHFHRVHFQMIYCYKGWVRVVYEDQGPDFVMRAGDCVLQPPQIRHRVLESSPGLEVIEMACPAEHETLADHALSLPTPTLHPDREFTGQRFVRHEAAGARWTPWRLAGFECRDTGVAAATKGLASARIARISGDAADAYWRHNADFLFTFLLAGEATLRCEGRAAAQLTAGDAFALPAGMGAALEACSDNLEILELSMPDLSREQQGL